MPRVTSGHPLPSGRVFDGFEGAKNATQRTVMVVEDNVLMRKLFVRCLEEGGFTVIEVVNPRHTLDLMHEVQPDLVVMDIMMPDLSGYDLIKAIRGDAKLAPVPVVAVTSLATHADKTRLAAAGFTGHVSKPINPKTFFATLSAFLDGANAPATA